MEQQENWWQRVRRPLLISVMDEKTLTERRHIRVSALGLFSIVVALLAITIGLLSLLVIFTPLRTVLPGYSEDIRQNLVLQTARIDSLGNDLNLQRQYLGVVRQVVAGEVAQADTIQSLDSMQVYMREQLLEAKSEAVQAFVAQYEQKEKDNLQLFNVQNVIPEVVLCRPTRGTVVEKFSPENGSFGVRLQALKNENVVSVLAGTVVDVLQEQDGCCSIVIQHDNYLSFYRHVGHGLKRVGDNVQAGESIAIITEPEPMVFCLWQNGKALDPESVVVF